MSVGKSSIKRVSGAESAPKEPVTEAVVEPMAPAKKPAAKKTTAAKKPTTPKKEIAKKKSSVSLTEELPYYLL